jgi:hypothetical protein
MGLLTAGAIAVAPSAHAVQHGTPVKTPPRSAAYIEWRDPALKAGAACTGTLAGSFQGDAVVLTAAHCLFDEYRDAATKKEVAVKIPPADFKVWLGLSDPRDSGKTLSYKVITATADPKYSPTAASVPDDVAVLRLDESYQLLAAAGTLPVALAPYKYSVPDHREVNAYGYGCVDEKFDDAGQPLANGCTYATSLNVTKVDSYVADTTGDGATSYYFEQTHPTGALPADKSAILPGDSGGPWFPNVSDPYVVAVSSHLSFPWDKEQRRWGGAEATRVSDPVIYTWLHDEAELHGGVAGHIYRFGSRAWLAQGDGFLHPIDSTKVYDCLVDSKHPVDTVAETDEGKYDFAEIPQDAAAPATCTVTTRWVGVQLPLPDDQSKTYPDPMTANVACTTSNRCTVVGSYADNTGDNLARPFIDSGSGTSWESVTAPLPGDAKTNNADLTAVACGKTCAALGQYQPKSGSFTLIEAGSSGSWTAVKAPMPDHWIGGGLSYVACGTECMAAGSEYGANGTDVHEGLLEIGKGASWTESIAPLPGNAAKPDPGLFWDGAACSAGTCLVYGTYVDKNNVTQGVVETETDGKWKAAELPYPKSTGAGQGFKPEAADCQSATRCTVVGAYASADGAGWTAMITGIGTDWNAVALPITYIGDTLSSVSCPTASTCTAAGAYLDDADIPQILTVTGEGTHWKEKFAPLPPHGGNVNQWVWPQGGGSVSCGSATSCVMAGTYYSISNAGPYLSTDRDGTWKTIEGPTPGNSQAPSDGRVYSVDCTGQYTCTAAGWYAPNPKIPNGYNGLPFVEVEVEE